jgi:hypothetical protein
MKRLRRNFGYQTSQLVKKILETFFLMDDSHAYSVFSFHDLLRTAVRAARAVQGRPGGAG